MLGVQATTCEFRVGGHSSVHNSTLDFLFYFIDICVLILTPLEGGKFLEGREDILVYILLSPIMFNMFPGLSKCSTFLVE